MLATKKSTTRRSTPDCRTPDPEAAQEEIVICFFREEVSESPDGLFSRLAATASSNSFNLSGCILFTWDLKLARDEAWARITTCFGLQRQHSYRTFSPSLPRKPKKFFRYGQGSFPSCSPGRSGSTSTTSGSDVAAGGSAWTSESPGTLASIVESKYGEKKCL